MKKHNYTLSIPADSKPEAEKKMVAIATILNGLKTKELEALARIIREEPGKIALAKQFLGL